MSTNGPYRTPSPPARITVDRSFLERLSDVMKCVGSLGMRAGAEGMPSVSRWPEFRALRNELEQTLQGRGDEQNEGGTAVLDPTASIADLIAAQYDQFRAIAAAQKAPAETQASISTWAEETFGPSGSNARAAARANREMSELLEHVTADDRHPEAAEEVADIVIVLYRVATRLGVDLHTLIDQKMATNRARTWKLDGTGHGYHVKEPTP